MDEVIYALWSRGNYSVLSANLNHKGTDRRCNEKQAGSIIAFF